MDSVASDSRLNVREESDWEEEVEVAIGEIERMMASPEQEEPLQDSDQVFWFSFFPEVSQQILRNEIAGRDNSRASARVVENLPLITVSEGGLGSGDGICAVCKDKYVEGEKVKVLPCVHRYHQDCILPWLRMHNTCPVCRFELPKDDSRLGGWRTVRDGGMHGGGLHSDTPI
ncbi:E3 ubiquitin-protein ligase RING1-like isoform X4 [Rhodamnia argentea]|uniref:RING-type E3 ubiquitin transferase n=1 Tax=Rhodamnia argentea TaxID=178133 RepID=A0A8B8QTS0_9MYRT|nr:E3 ubiquitin-protein ligase RING1-like isoform X4 [Rhodamnia argentea]